MAGHRVRVALVLPGDELVEGRVYDRNGGWLGRQFTELGCEVTEHRVVRDRSADLDRALSDLRADWPRIHLIVVAAGMGSTDDDKSRIRIARATGRPLEMHQRLAARLRRQATRIPEDERAAWLAAALEQAMLPAGAVVVMPTRDATAAAFVVVPDAASDYPIIMGLPGPPPEVRGVFRRVLRTPPIRALLADVAAPRQRTISLVPGTRTDETLLGQTDKEARRTLGIYSLQPNICFAAGGAELNVVTTFPEGTEHEYERYEGFMLDRHGGDAFSVAGQTVDEIFATLVGGRTVAILGTAAGVGLLSTRIEGLAATWSISLDPTDRGAAIGSALLARLGVAPPGATLRAEELAAGIAETLGTDISIGLASGRKRQRVDVAVFDSTTGVILRRTLALPDPEDETDTRFSTEVMHLLRLLLEQSSFSR